MVAQWLQTWYSMLVDIYDQQAFAFCLYFAIGAVELLFPAQQGQSVAGRLRNFMLTVINVVVGMAVLGAVTMMFPLRRDLLQDRGIASSIALCVGYMFVFDFIFYWYHRLQHKWQAFWAVHELHHSDTELNTTSAMRSFWLEQPLQYVLITVPTLALVGVDAMSTNLLMFTMTGWLLISHANVRLKLGFLTPVICGPQVHRIHHSILPQHHDKNFANFFPIIDIVFGTYYKPEKDEFPPTGTESLKSDVSVLTALNGPFAVWLRSLNQLVNGFQAAGNK
jgi:sterol desaturase/sphingolipid hydroxylase (fatty acid hydroxylase superfamily)